MWEKNINSGEQTGSDPVCFWQPTRTHRPLTQKKSFSEELFRSTGWEELFKKILFRRLGSEEILLTTRTPRTPQLCSRRRIVQKPCLGRAAEEETFQKTWFWRRYCWRRTPRTPRRKQSSSSYQRWPAVKPWFSTTTSDDPERSGWRLEDLSSRKLTAIYRRDQCSDERRWRRPSTDDSSLP